jgi:hypothetical protein
VTIEILTLYSTSRRFDFRSKKNPIMRLLVENLLRKIFSLAALQKGDSYRSWRLSLYYK